MYKLMDLPFYFHPLLLLGSRVYHISHLEGVIPPCGAVWNWLNFRDGPNCRIWIIGTGFKDF